MFNNELTRRSRVSIAWLAVTVVSAASAQSTDPAAAIPAQENEARVLASGWLRSSDPRLQAWGAYVASRYRDTRLAPDLIEFVRAYRPSANARFETGRYDAMTQVLDAIIQCELGIDVTEVARLAEVFPDQAIILLARLRGDKASPALLDIFRTRPGLDESWQAAGNLLAQRQAPGFAAEVLGSMTVHARIRLAGPQPAIPPIKIAPKRRDGAPIRVYRNWPDIFRYFLTCENRNSPTLGGIVLAPGIDPVHYFRSFNGATWSGACVESDLAREHFLVTLAAARQSEPPIRSQLTHEMTWSGDRKYLREVNAFVADQQSRFAEIAMKLDAGSARPKLEVIIEDLRAKRTTLPVIATGNK
jgi:hypothetical protein